MARTEGELEEEGEGGEEDMQANGRMGCEGG